MSKFKMHLKISNVEIEVESDRPDAAQIGQAIGSRLAGLIASPAEEIASDRSEEDSLRDVSRDEGAILSAQKRKPAAKRSAKAPGATTDQKPINFTHDPKKYGNPLQSWSTRQKCYWLLYVLQKEANMKEASDGQLADTFNKHFKEAGQLRSGYVSRDLGKDKVKKLSPVGQDTSKPTAPWFLTDEGTKAAEQLVKDALSP